MPTRVQPSVIKNMPQNLAALIAEGRFTHVNPDITEENFPITVSIAEVSDMLTLTQTDLGGQNMTISEIEGAIDRKGCRPASLAEQLVYAKTKWNGRDMVFALGSSWVDTGGNRYVPYLCADGDDRELLLFWERPGYLWRETFPFLVVRK